MAKDSTPATVEAEVLALVEKWGAVLVGSALVEFLSGGDLATVIDHASKRAIRLATDAEASELLK